MNCVQEQECVCKDFPSSFGQSCLQITVYPGTFCGVLLDSNGNITDLVNNDGALLAHYEYSAYGEVIAMSGVEAENNPYRFSTKYWDRETDLGYWDYRYGKDGRWLSRDPIEEHGGVNLLKMCGNNCVNDVDAFGAVTLDLFADLWLGDVDDNVDNVLNKIGVSVFGQDKTFALEIEGKCICDEKSNRWKAELTVRLWDHVYVSSKARLKKAEDTAIALYKQLVKQFPKTPAPDLFRYDQERVFYHELSHVVWDFLFAEDYAARIKSLKLEEHLRPSLDDCRQAIKNYDKIYRSEYSALAIKPDSEKMGLIGDVTSQEAKKEIEKLIKWYYD